MAGRLGLLLFLFPLVIVAASCTGDDPQPQTPSDACPGPGCPGDGGLDAGNGDSGSKAVLLALDPTDLAITQGATAKTKVDIQRLGGVTAPVHIEVTGLPSTILAGSLTLAPDQSTGDLVFSATPDAAQTKTPLALTVTARAESGESTTKDLKLTVRGAPGNLDVDFGNKGTIVQSFGTGNDVAKCVLFDAMGRLYVGGNTTNGGTVARYTDDGKLDTTYAAPNGYVVGPAMSLTEDCTMQPDGKVVFAGNYNGDLAVTRVNADGTPDTGFGSSGRAVQDFGGTERGTGIVVLADGTIVVTGFSTNGTPSEKFIAMRVSSAGVVGTTSALTNVQAHDQAFGAALAKNGDVLMVGMSGPSYLISDVTAVILQALAPSSLARDTANFGNGQGYILDGYYSTNQFYSGRAVVQSDGKVVVAGNGYGTSTMRVIRYGSAGAVDSSFATGGHASIAVGTASAGGTGLALQKDGKVVVVGYATSASAELSDFGVVRLGTDGQLDASFHGDGKLVVPVQPMTPDEAYAVGIQPDGKIVVAGQTLTGAGNFDWAIARIWP
jgi:uncharacterized delta-60 repeat protein